MTKQPADENVLKFHLTVGETNRVGEANALMICDSQVSSELEEKSEVAPIINEIKPRKSRLGKIMSELYNLEDGVEKEKTMKIDLDLDIYQMEKV